MSLRAAPPRITRDDDKQQRAAKNKTEKQNANANRRVTQERSSPNRAITITAPPHHATRRQSHVNERTRATARRNWRI